MKNKLPSVFANHRAKQILGNNKTIFYSKNNSETINVENNEITFLIKMKKINEIFSSPSFVYKTNVMINTKNRGLIKETIVSKNKNGIVTMEGKTINYEDIIDINKEN